MKEGPIVAIDGPAGTGKSSATCRLAQALGFTHIDTGALYRAVAYLTWKAVGLKSPVQAQVAIKIAQEAHFEFQRFPDLNPSNRIFVEGRDVTDFIRTATVSTLASDVSALPPVREALLGLQRHLGERGKTILEGRDIGTVVFPQADIKFFLTANLEERAKRRLLELEGAGQDVPSYQEVLQQMKDRDDQDTHRPVAPLKKAEDALLLDTTNLTLDQVVEAMEKHIRMAH